MSAVAMSFKKNDVLEYVEKDYINTVQIGFIDMQGVLRGKYIPAKYFLTQMEKGIPFCVVALGWDIGCAIVEGIKFASWDNGYGDMVAKPDLSTFQLVPWKGKTAFVMCDLVTEHGDPIAISPRYLLKKLIGEANSLGYMPNMASELEFYLLKEDMKPLYNGIQCYNIYKGAELEFIMSEIRDLMAQMGIDIEASNTEYGPAQVEVNLRYSTALDAADKTAVFKNGIREIARSHKLVATFMSKPWHGESGNGYHVHQSLWDIKSGTNVFLKDKHEMSDIMKSYLGGMLKYGKELYALGAWSVNAYKRVAPYSYAPTQVNWGIDNRTTGVRAVLGGGGTRLENRMGAAEANPYIAFAANLAAGLEGIKNKLSIPERILADGYKSGAGDPLPTSLKQATDLLDKSAIARKYFGDEFIDTYVTMCRHETTAFERIVHQWERDRYLEMA